MATEYVYEILIRGNPTGIAGAHLIRGREVTDSDGDLRQKLGKAEPVAVEALAELLGADLAKYVSQNSSMLVQIDDLEQKLELAKLDATKAQNALVASQTAAAALTAENAELRQALQEAKAAQLASCCHEPIIVSQ